MASAPGVEHFVRQTLGCGCPDEVFTHIKDDQLSSDLRRIDIGGRLLVYLVQSAEGQLSNRQLARYLRRGREERDALGFNRFRLVLAVDPVPAEAGTWTHAFERLRAGDDRLHLHIIPVTALPGPPPTTALSTVAGLRREVAQVSG